MAGGLNKKKALRSAKRAKKGRDGAKRRTTRENKIRRLERHLRTNSGDGSAKKALTRWKENPPNGA